MIRERLLSPCWTDGEIVAVVVAPSPLVIGSLMEPLGVSAKAQIPQREYSDMSSATIVLSTKLKTGFVFSRSRNL